MGASVSVQGLVEFTSMVKRHLPSLQHHIVLIIYMLTSAVIIQAALSAGVNYVMPVIFFTCMTGLVWKLNKHQNSHTLTPGPRNQASGNDAGMQPVRRPGLFQAIDTGRHDCFLTEGDGSAYLVRTRVAAKATEFIQHDEDGLNIFEVASGAWKGYWLGVDTNGVSFWRFKRECACWEFNQDHHMICRNNGPANRTAGHRVSVTGCTDLSDQHLYCNNDLTLCEVHPRSDGNTVVFIVRLP